jgi:oligopeptide/dipeptide ABC transporter ATP-binding protein
LTLLSIEDLTVAFRGERGEATAIEDVSLAIGPGEILGVVGESGSGKSVTALSVMGLLPEPAARVVRGRVVFEGQVLTGMPEYRLRRVRGPGIGMVFQEPMTSLNPVFSIGEQIVETLAAHGEASRSKQRDLAVEMLERVGIPSAAHRLKDFPHQLSGGQRQRVMIAMALACRPRLLIADEPTTALDLTIQAGILDLMLDLREQLGMAMLVITHNMGVIAEVADRVAVMYAGRVVEQAPVEQLFAAPGHPYTRALLACVPALEDDRQRLASIPGSLPDPGSRPPGCRFAPRCPLHVDACDAEVPPLLSMGHAHEAACIRIGAA